MAIPWKAALGNLNRVPILWEATLPDSNRAPACNRQVADPSLQPRDRAVGRSRRRRGGAEEGSEHSGASGGLLHVAQTRQEECRGHAVLSAWGAAAPAAVAQHTHAGAAHGAARLEVVLQVVQEQGALHRPQPERVVDDAEVRVLPARLDHRLRDEAVHFEGAQEPQSRVLGRAGGRHSDRHAGLVQRLKRRGDVREQVKRAPIVPAPHAALRQLDEIVERLGVAVPDGRIQIQHHELDVASLYSLQH
mmetsp:Transcript_10299/g.34073  ORF Transcript_10299/g.34073 Transcript_10299/m.34073 type:complete len:248 (-) Transcript_10299:42-785(-)|eukprot:scaffold18354_cov134-Isochrysis_galbana.AAC.4